MEEKKLSYMVWNLPLIIYVHSLPDSKEHFPEQLYDLKDI